MSTTHQLELFYRPTCPYCIKVLSFIEEHQIDGITMKNISEDPAARERLVTVGGKQQVPCLFIDGTPLYESSDIVEWLREDIAGLHS
jgi:glutaredoxin